MSVEVEVRDHPDAPTLHRAASAAVRQDRRRLMALYLVLATAVPLIYVCVTHHIWEDYFITFRHSVNFVEGRGLTFNPPDRVHGFTSAINVMLPALFYWITGQHGYEAALNLFRAASLIALVAGGWFTLRWMLERRGIDRLSPILFILLFATEAKTIAYSMNGQETGFMVCFLSLMFAMAYRGVVKHWRMMGLAFAGLLYTRPDAPVYIAAVGITCLAFRHRDSFGAVFLALLKAGALAVVIYLPWFASMWWYYGTPVPHTIIAKSGFGDLDWMYPEKIAVKWLGVLPRQASLVFLPLNRAYGGWPEWLLVPFGAVCWVLSASYWLIPSRDRAGRMASLMFFFSLCYIATIGVSAVVFSWYLPSAALFSTIVLSRGIPQIFRWLFRGAGRSMVAARVVQGAIVTVWTLLLIATIWQIRIQQAVIENGNRKQVGLYLRDVVQPGERVYLEPLGYIGYFSGAHILDWPGLVTPEVERLHHQRKLGQMNMIRVLKPEWLVLRDYELRMASPLQEMQEHYRVVRTFDVRPTLERYGYIPGRNYLIIDSVFHVLQRVPASSTAPAPATMP